MSTQPHQLGQRNIVNIVGERVELGPLSRGLLPTYGRWYNDFELNRTFGFPSSRTAEVMEAWLRQQVESPAAAWFTVYRRDPWLPIGLTALLEINHQHGTALFTLVIGERKTHGKGYGTEVTRLMLDYAFTALGLHNVMLRVGQFNVAGRRAYHRAGFREFGRRHECLRQAGRYWDTIYMECVASDLASPVPAEVFPADAPRSW